MREDGGAVALVPRHRSQVREARWEQEGLPASGGCHLNGSTDDLPFGCDAGESRGVRTVPVQGRQVDRQQRERVVVDRRDRRGGRARVGVHRGGASVVESPRRAHGLKAGGIGLVLRRGVLQHEPLAKDGRAHALQLVGRAELLEGEHRGRRVYAGQ